jgi:hypothetical protein
MKRYKPQLKESKFVIEVSLYRGNVQKTLDILHDIKIPFKQDYSNRIVFKNKYDYENALEALQKQKIEIEGL